MDLAKIGNFIKECRKKKNMTQQELANKINVEANTISKWERGKGLPDVSLMSPLCETLGISIGELFIGDYIKNDSENSLIEKAMVDYLKQETTKNKKNFIGELLVGISSIFLLTMNLLLIGFSLAEAYIKIIIIVLSILLGIITIIGLVILDINIGYFECEECHERFIPTTKEYIFGVHTIRKRRLKCPNCHKKTWCLKRISKE